MIEKLEANNQTKSLLKNKDNFNRNLLQSAARQNESLNCHEYLWETVENYFDIHEILNMIHNIDDDNDNVLHSAVFNNLKEIAKFTWKKIQTFLEADEQVKYLKTRGHRQKNLKKLSLENTKDHEVVGWVENLIGSIYSKHPNGSPATVLTISHDQQLIFNNKQLQEMFSHPDVKNRQIVVISIIGAPRKGKSFLLNYCLRYLYAHHPSINYLNHSNSNYNKWIGDDDEPLIGFAWNSSTNSDDNSVNLWSDVFLPRNKEGRQNVAIVVMDSQNCTENYCHMFDIASLFSSTLILNLSGSLKENNLRSLKEEIEAVTKLSENKQTNDKIFQNCIFLIRDWENVNNYKARGGIDYLDKILSSESDEQKVMIQINKLSERLFENVNCCMLSYPGKTIETGTVKNSNYDGNWGEMDGDFRDELIGFIENELNLENFIPKRVNGRSLRGSEFLKYIEFQLESYQLNKSFDYNKVDKEFLENKTNNILTSSSKSIDEISETEYSHRFCKADKINPDYNSEVDCQIINDDRIFKSDNLKQDLDLENFTKSPVDQIMEIIVASLIEDYEDLIHSELGSVTNITELMKLQENCEMKIISKYDNAAKIVSNENKIKFKNILIKEINKINKNLSSKMENNTKNIECEIKIVDLKILELENCEEKQKIIIQQVEKDLETLKNQDEQEQLIKKAEIKLALEKQRLLRIKAEMDVQKCLRVELQSEMDMEKLIL